MLRKIFAILLVVTLSVLIPIKVDAAAATASVWIATPTAMVETRDAMDGYPEQPLAYDDVTTTTTTASTTSVSLTAATGRKLMSVYVNGTGELWMNPGGSTAVLSSGIKITDRLEDIPINANCPVSFIASTTDFTYTTVEYQVRQKPNR